MIVFKTVRCKNFLSVGNSWFEVKLDENKSTLISGRNGAGKSTFMDAITFALFGKPYRNINLAGLINTINNTKMIVEIEFDIGSKEYKVVRGFRPETFEIYEDGVLVEQESNKRDYQFYLEKSILGFNYRSFVQIVIVGVTSFTPFMRLQKWERREIVEDLLDIDVFTKMNNLLKNKSKINVDRLNEANLKISNIEELIKMNRRFIEDSRRDVGEQIKKLQRESRDNTKKINESQTQIETLNANIKEYQRQTVERQAIIEQIRKLEKIRSQIENNQDRTVKELEFFNENNDCPRCKQQITNKETMIKECGHKIVEFDDGLKRLDKKHQSFEERLEEINKFLGLISKAQEEIGRHNILINEKQKQNTKLSNSITQLSGKINNDNVLLVEAESLEKDLNIHKGKKEECIDSGAYFDIASLLLKDSGIKSKIIKQYLPLINKTVNKYLAELDFFVNLEIDEEFNETIKSRHRDEFRYDNFSEGEKLRIDLALLFTWRTIAKMKNSMNTNLLILDEVFDSSLDSQGTDEFMNLLNTFAHEANVFLISHKSDILAEKFNNTIKIEKIGNFTEIV